MNIIMNIPRFTAEASLYKTSRQYQMAGTPKDLVGSRGVLPQLPIGFCMADCDFTERDPLSNIACKFGCFEEQEGGGGGGPGDPVCTPSCTPCRRVAGKPGRWKTCISRNCDDYEVRCR
jgi:hypothetical protein